MRHWTKKAGLGLLTALAFFTLVELGLRSVYGPPANERFLRPMWLRDGPLFRASGDTVETVYQSLDRIDPFPAKPTEGKTRLMGFGESSMRGGSGLPPSREFLGLIASELTAQGEPVEAINLGRSGMDTNLLPRLVREALAYSPDMAVFYFGHNDIANSTLERRYGDLGGALEARLTVLAERTQLFTQLQRAIGARHTVGAVKGQSSTLRMSPEQTRAAEANYERNLRESVRRCQAAGVDTVLITPASPIDRWFASAPVCPDALPTDAWAQWRGGWQLRLDRISPEDVEKAHASAPECPEVEYLWGLLLLKRGQRAEGWATLAKARDDDPQPMRATSGIVEIVREVAADTDSGLVDFEASLRERDSLTGLFTDNVHLNVETHILLAKLAAPVVAERIERRRE